MPKVISWITAFTLASVPALAGTILTDSTFNLANYTVTPLYNSDPGNATASFNQCASCGNPGQALQFLASGLLTDVLAIGFVNNLTYDPTTQGAIASIDFSVDKNIVFNQVVVSSNTFRPLIEQDGIFYMAAIPGPDINNATTSGYLTFSGTGLAATDFLSFNFVTGAFSGSSPNFSGGPMKFGLGQTFMVGVYNSLGVEVDYDNLNVKLNVVTPEPSSFLLLGAGLAGLAVHMARQRILSLTCDRFVAPFQPLPGSR
jgi:hypothetical protein